MDLKDYILKEKEFLHEVSNHLVVAQGNANFLKRSFESEVDQLSEKERDKFAKLNLSIDKLLASLKKRKEFVSHQS